MKKCNHNWYEFEVKYYFTWWGDRIKSVTLVCENCKKKRVEKYW